MPETIYKQGDTLLDPKTGQGLGEVSYNPYTGVKLPQGGSYTDTTSFGGGTTPTNTTGFPKMGDKGDIVAQYQAALNRQNEGKTGWSPINVDGVFGPKTQAATTFAGPPKNNLITTGTNPAKDFAQNSQYINSEIQNKGNTTNTANTTNASTDTTKTNPDGSRYDSPDLNYSDPYTQMLDKISATSDKATQNLISTIKANKANQMRTINEDTDRLKSGLMSLGLSTGNINFTPDLVYGGIAQAENARMSKLMQLDRDEATALLEAQQASENKQFDVLKDRVAYLKSIKKSRLDILKEDYDTMATETKISDIQAHQIYEPMQKMNATDKKAYLEAVSKKYGIPFSSLVTSLADEKATREEDAVDLQNKKRIAGGGGKGSTASKASLKKAGTNILVTGKDSEGKKIGNPKGADGYVDPYVYMALFEDWPGTSAEFLTAFPVKNVNPKSYSKLPEAIRPKTTKASGRGS